MPAARRPTAPRRGIASPKPGARIVTPSQAATIGHSKPRPDFKEIANRTSTTGLSLKVFLQTSHPSMPNLILKPDESDDLINYILSLKRN